MAVPITIDANLRLVGVERTIADAVRRVNPVIRAKLDAQSVRGFQEPLGKITGKVSEFEKSLEAANARVIAFGASVGVLNAAYRGFSNLVKVTIDVEKQLADINVVLNTNNEGLEKFSKKLFEIARNTGQAFGVAANAATELARQGLSAEETLKRVNDSLILTRLSGLDVVSSVEALTATINGFSKAGLETSQVINKLANVDAAFAVSSRDLAEALSRVGSTAQDARVSFDELLAIITSVQQTTARGGAVIGNSLKTIFTRLGRSQTLKELEDLGVQIRDISGAALPALDILQNLANTFDKVGESQQNAIAEQVGGVFQINILRSALKDLGRDYSIYGRALETSLGSSDQAFRRNIELNKTLSALINATTQEIVEFANKVGDVSVGPGLRSLIQSFREFFSVLNGTNSGLDLSPLIEGFAKGLTSIFTGPGLVTAVAAFVNLVSRAFRFAGDALKTIVTSSSQLENQKRIQNEINSILRSDNGEYSKKIASLNSIAEKERFILNLIRERVKLNSLGDAQNALLASRISENFSLSDRGLKRRGIRGIISPNFANYDKVPNYADNVIPNFAHSNYSLSAQSIRAITDRTKGRVGRSDVGSAFYGNRGIIGIDPMEVKKTFGGKFSGSFALGHEYGHMLDASAIGTSYFSDKKMANKGDKFAKLSLEKRANRNFLDFLGAYGTKKDIGNYKKFAREQMFKGYKLPLLKGGGGGIVEKMKALFYPSFANPITSAIQREISAGVSPSQVKVGRSSSLVSNFNPQGLAVYNTRDEPGGLHQGISRAKREGRDPKSYGLPNFAPRIIERDILSYSDPDDIQIGDFYARRSNLYKQFPFLSNIDVKFERGFLRRNDSFARYIGTGDGEGAIIIDRDTFESSPRKLINKVIQHELGHALQDKLTIGEGVNEKNIGKFGSIIKRARLGKSISYFDLQKLKSNQIPNFAPQLTQRQLIALRQSLQGASPAERARIINQIAPEVKPEDIDPFYVFEPDPFNVPLARAVHGPRGRFVSKSRPPPLPPIPPLQGSLGPFGEFRSKRILEQIEKTSAEGRRPLDLATNQFLESITGGQPRFSAIRGLRQTLNRGSLPGHSENFFGTLSQISNPEAQNFTEIFNKTVRDNLNKFGTNTNDLANAMKVAEEKIRNQGATTEQINKISERLVPDLQNYRIQVRETNKSINRAFKDLNRSERLSGIESRIFSGQSVTGRERGFLIKARQGEFLRSQAQNLFGENFNQLDKRQQGQILSKLSQKSNISGALSQIALGIQNPNGFTSSFKDFAKTQRFGRLRSAFGSRALEEKFLQQLKTGNSNIDIDAERDRLFQARQARSGALTNRLFLGTFGASFASGLLGGSENKIVKGAGSVLQGAATGASFGLIGGPIAAGIGAVGGGLIGLYQAINDTSSEFEKLNSAIQENVDRNTKLVNSTQNYIQLQQQISDAIKSGASEVDIQNFFRQSNTALKNVNDIGIRGRLLAAGTNQDELRKIIQDVSERFNRQAQENDVRQASFAVQTQRNSVLERLGFGSTINGQSLRELGQTVSKTSNFSSSEQIDEFISLALANPSSAFGKFKDQLGLNGREIDDILKSFGKNTNAFKAFLNELSQSLEENVKLSALSPQRQNITRISERLDIILSDVNRQIKLENKIRELNNSSNIKLIEEFSNTKNVVSTQDPFSVISNQLKTQLNVNNLNTAAQRSSTIRGGIGQLITGFEDTEQNRKIISSLTDILNGTKEFNINDLEKITKDSSSTIKDAIKDLKIELQLIERQSSNTVKELSIISELNKLQLVNEQKNRLLDSGGFSLQRGRQISANFSDLLNAGGRKNQITALENVLSSIESLGLPTSGQDQKEIRSIREGSVRQSFSDILSRITKTKVGTSDQEINDAASLLANTRGNDAKSQGTRITGRRILLGLSTLKSDPEEELNKLKSALEKGDTKGLLNTKGIGFETTGIVLATNNVKQSVDSGFLKSNDQLSELIASFKQNKDILEEQLSIAKSKQEGLRGSVEREQRRAERFSGDRIFGASIDKFTDVNTLAPLLRGAKLAQEQDASLKGLKNVENIGDFIKENESLLRNDSNEFVNKFVEKFQTSFIEAGVGAVGRDGKKIITEKTQEFITALFDKILFSLAESQPITKITAEQQIKEGTKNIPIVGGLPNQFRTPSKIVNAPGIEAQKQLLGSLISTGGGKIAPNTKGKLSVEQENIPEIKIPKIEETTSTQLNINKFQPLKDFFVGFKETVADTTSDSSRRLLEFSEIGSQVALNFEDAFSNAFGDFATGTKSAGDAFKSFISETLSYTSRLFAQQGIRGLFATIAQRSGGGSGGVSGSGAIQFASGGKVPSLLTGGEFVVNRNLASKIGYSKLGKLNKKETGGLITGGSGVRDDIFTMLNPGDFVLNKQSTSRLGLQKMAAGGISRDNPYIRNIVSGTPTYNPNAASVGGTTGLGGSAVNSGALSGTSNAASSIGSSLGGATGQIGVGIALALIGRFLQEKPKGPYYDLVKQQREIDKQRKRLGNRGSYVYQDGNLVGFGEVNAPRRFNRGGTVPAMLTGGEYVVPNYRASSIGYNKLQKFNKGGMVENSPNSDSIPNISINITMNNDGSSNESSQKSQSDNLNKFADRIKVLVRTEITEQKRNGGLLSNTK